MPEVPFPEAETEESAVPFPEAAAPEVPFPDAQKPTQDQQIPFPEAETQDQTLSAPEQPVQSHKQGVIDFGNHVGRDAWEDLKNTIGGVVSAPIHAVKNVYQLFKDAALNKQTGAGRPTFDQIKDAYSDQFSQMGDGMVTSWGKWYQPDHWEADPNNPGRSRKVEGSVPAMIGRKFYHEPTSAVLDAMAAVDLGGSVTGALGKVTGSARLEELGSKIRSAPGDVVQKGWDKVKESLPVGLGGGDPVVKRLYLGHADEEVSAVKPKANADKNEVLRSWREASPDERATAHDLNVAGATHEELNTLMPTDRTMAAADAYKNYVENVRQPTLSAFNTESLTPEVFENRLVKQYAKARYDMTDLSPQDFAAMKAEMNGLARKPVYVPAKFEAEGLAKGGSLEELMNAPFPGVTKSGMGRKAQFMEKYSGKAPFESDPMQYIPKVVDSFRKVEGDLNLGNRILQEPSLVRSAVSGEEGILKGMDVSGIMKKYLNEGDRAKAVFFRELEATYGAEKATRLMMEDATTQKQLRQVAGVVADPTLERLLKQEYYLRTLGSNKFVRLYDRLNQLVKMGATRLNPRYYTGVSVGQAMMSLFSGTMPKWGMRARELAEAGALPPQAVHVALQGGAMQKLLNAADVHDALGTATRAGMITKFAAKRLGLASDAGFKTMGTANQALSETMQSTRNLSEFQVARQQLHERMVAQAGAVGGVDREIARLLKEEDVALQKHNSVVAGGGNRTASYGAVQDIRREIARLQANRNLMAGELEMKAVDSGALSAQIPEFQKYADILRPAVRDTNVFLANSNALTPIEKYIWRRVVPYYGFNKTITQLAFKLPFVAPTSAFMWSRLSAELNRMYSDPELGDRMKGYYPMYLRQDGSTVWINAQGLSHAGGLGLSHVGGIPVPNMLNPIKANHFLSLGYRLLGGKTDFDIKTVPFGTDEMFVNGHNGEVISLDENGKPVTQIPQLPLVKGVAHMFPWVQYAEHVLQPYQQTQEGWLLNPQAIKKPDGTYRYPYEMMQSLPQMLGVKVLPANRGELISQKKMHEVGVLREMEKALKTAGPDQREMLLQGIKDYTKGLQQENLNK